MKSHNTIQADGVYFLHIPKTAGSSFNEHFLSFFGPEKSLVHFENDIAWKTRGKAYFEQFDFVAGHVPFDVFEENAGHLKRLRFAVLRKPMDHLLSHLSWLRNLHLDPERFRLTPSFVLESHRRLNAIDFSNFDELAKFFSSLSEMEHGLLNNRQCRYFHHIPDDHPYSSFELSLALSNMKQFNFVGLFERLDESLGAMTSLLGHSVPRLPKSNSTNPKLPIDLDAPEVSKILLPHIKYDQILYEECLKEFWCASTSARSDT